MCFLDELDDVIEKRDAERPEDSYTATLLDREDLRLEKLGEEAVELILACKDGEDEVHEAADLIYHTLVALRGAGYGLDDVERELRGRSIAEE